MAAGSLGLHFQLHFPCLKNGQSNICHSSSPFKCFLFTPAFFCAASDADFSSHLKANPGRRRPAKIGSNEDRTGLVVDANGSSADSQSVPLGMVVKGVKSGKNEKMRIAKHKFLEKNKSAVKSFKNSKEASRQSTLQEKWPSVSFSGESFSLAGGTDDEGLDSEDYDETEDPNWPENDTGNGWGFSFSDFFAEEPKVMSHKQKKADESDDDSDIDWDADYSDPWAVKEISLVEWESAIFDNQVVPLLVYVFKRYGDRCLDNWNMMKTLEGSVKKFWDCHKGGLQAVKLDAGRNRDLASALKITEYPCLLFIREGWLLYRSYGVKTEDEVLQLTAHLFYGSHAPSCLDQDKLTKEYMDMS